MQIRTQIEEYLDTNGRSTVAEVANGINYSNGWARQNLKEMRNNGRIQGSKATRIPAVIIGTGPNSSYVVLTGDRQYLLKIVKNHAPHLLSRAKGLSVEKLQKLIRDKIAIRVGGGPHRWEFWKP